MAAVAGAAGVLVSVLVLLPGTVAISDSDSGKGAIGDSIGRGAIREVFRSSPRLERAAGPAPPAPPPELLQADDGGVVRPVQTDQQTAKIVLSMSAFRDGARCARTMGFALARALHPDRIHFRVMQALNEGRGDRSCAKEFAENQLADYCRGAENVARCRSDVLERVTVWTIPLEMAMGPAHQRGLLNEVRDHDDPLAFCLNADSHMDFHERWDELMIKEWVGIDNEFAVCTAYPMAMMGNQDRAFASAHVDLCGWYLEGGIPRGQGGDNLRSAPSQNPYLTMNWAAGFSFGRCHMDRNVPVDKHLQWIFTGEEVDRAVRLWTSGYDLYLPAFTYIYHDYGNARQEFWTIPHNPSLQSRSQERIRRKLNISYGNGWGQPGHRLRIPGVHRVPPPESDGEPEPELGLFGLGDQRTLEQYVEWARVDLGTDHWQSFLASRGLTPLPKGSHTYCQTLKRVPVKSSKALHESVYKGGLMNTSQRFRRRLRPDLSMLPVVALDEGSGL